MNFLRWCLRLAVLGALGTAWVLAGVYLYLSPNLPNVETLRDVRLQTPMRVYSADGALIGQFGEQKRNPLAYDEIPQQFVNALLSAEDDGFFEHRGIDIGGLLRAVSELLITGEKGSGGSTLTMQVARNYFLSLERTFFRKFNEILLAIEIERRLSKQEIFELYVNRIFLGHRAYGFEAASQVYYGKSIGELTLAQHAMLAGVPKSPSTKNPLSGPEDARARRNWILGRMLALEYIDDDAYQQAIATPVTATRHGAAISLDARYAAEMARRQMLQRYGLKAYTEGYSVYTTINGPLQEVANESIVAGLRTYDARHGYRGPEANWLDPERAPELALPLDDWILRLSDLPSLLGLEAAIVFALDDGGAQIAFANGQRDKLPWEGALEKVRPYVTENRRGNTFASATDLLKVGDVIRVERTQEGLWSLAQIPDAQAALVSLDPMDGAIISLVGGIGYDVSKFNRATQAQRQPGSNFKPFLYAAALSVGRTAATVVNDAPIVIEDRSLEGVWRPENDSGKFFGPTRLRWALTKSRNLVSIRLLQDIGIETFIDYATQLGFDTGAFAADLSLALGTHAMTPLDVATAYAILANGGYRVEPYLITRIDNLVGETVFAASPAVVCDNCEATDGQARGVEDGTAGEADELSMEQILSQGEKNAEPATIYAERVMDERINFIIDSILKDVIKRGTGRKALALGREDIAGKTGTTNGPMDAWFSGYSSSLVTSTWVGFDEYTPLGNREFGGTAALPIWIEFMRVALEGTPERAKNQPEGISYVRIDPETGAMAPSSQRSAIFEFFRNENLPQSNPENFDGNSKDTENLIQDIF